MKITDIIISIIVLLFSMKYILISIVDYYELATNPTDYIRVYHLNQLESNLLLQYFFKKWSGDLFAIIGLILSTISLLNRNKKWFNTVKIFTLINIIYIIYFYYSWAQTGFDH